MLSLSVKYSEAAGILTFEAINKARKELNLEIEITEQDVDRLNHPENLVNGKKHTGAPSKQAVLSMIENQSQSLNEIMSGIRQIKEKTATARNRCF